MAEYRLPHEVYYEITERVSVSDVIDSLLGIEDLLTEVGPLLEACVPGLVVERIEVDVREISQSSLKELLWAAIFVAYQTDLEKDVPNLLENLFGTKVGHEYPTIVTILFLLLTFYGLDFVYKRLAKIAEGSRIKEQLDGLIAEAANHCGISEARIRQILEERYVRGRMRRLVQASLKLFQPSKAHGNVGIRVSGRRIEPKLVADVPSGAQMLEFEEPPPTRSLTDVEIELHAQDVDHTRQGWAAVIPSVSKRRVRMELYPPIMPVDLYTRTRVRGDVLAVYRESQKGEMEPCLYHLVRLIDQPVASHPSPAPPVPPERA
jgi:hypothetical protein